jgi:exonuclease VII small subunit
MSPQPQPEAFELRAAVAELEQLEAYFQNPTTNFEEALQQYQRAKKLVAEIETYLAKVTTTLEVLDQEDLKSEE